MPSSDLPTQPDFIIGGAPKCGTTSLHQVLDQHPAIWMAKNELYYFDADDPVAHADFLGLDGKDLTWRSPHEPALQDWYRTRFADAPKGCLKGEDTTTYLMSDVAPFRIASCSPDTKVIFMLRDPVERAISQYWHLVRSGRTCVPFEQALSREPSIVLGSTYAPRLREFLTALGPKRVHVVLFEEFRANQQDALDTVTNFLGVAPLPSANLQTWHNRTLYPVRTETLLRLNHVGRILVRYRYARHFADRPGLLSRAAHKAYRRWARMIERHILTQPKPPSSIREKTRDYLSQHLSDRNAGLSDLIGKDLSLHWPGFSQ